MAKRTSKPSKKTSEVSASFAQAKPPKLPTSPTPPRLPMPRSAAEVVATAMKLRRASAESAPVESTSVESAPVETSAPIEMNAAILDADIGITEHGSLRLSIAFDLGSNRRSSMEIVAGAHAANRDGSFILSLYIRTLAMMKVTRARQLAGLPCRVFAEHSGDNLQVIAIGPFLDGQFIYYRDEMTIHNSVMEE